MRILSLDASTTTIGIAVIDYNNGYQCKLIHSEYYKPDKSIDLLDMLIKARSYILDIAIKYEINEFVIEDYLKFMKGKSSAATVIPLAILNTTLRLMIWDQLQIQSQALNVLKIRHALKLTKQLPTKEEIPDLVAHHLGIKYNWLYKINKRTKQQVIREESYDVADAIAVGLALVKIKSIPVKKKGSRKKK
jgi:Holliday junction resolvasome RuvABC endonuclease subunit